MSHSRFHHHREWVVLVAVVAVVAAVALRSVHVEPVIAAVVAVHFVVLVPVHAKKPFS